MDSESRDRHSDGLDPRVIVAVMAGFAGLATAGGLAFWMLRAVPAPPAADPLLARGREVYYERCNGCHGDGGKGDGPTAKSIQGPPPGDLTDGNWKHGDRPEQVLAVLDRGVQGTAMAGWKNILPTADVRAAAAYVYELASRPVPAELRDP